MKAADCRANEVIGELLRDARVAMGLSQTKFLHKFLAIDPDCTWDTAEISRFESGKKRVTPFYLEMYAKVMGITLPEMFRRVANAVEADIKR